MGEGGEGDEVAAETQTIFDINLNMLIDCLTIYGMSGSTSSSTGGTWKSRKRGEDEEERVRGPMDDFLASFGSKRRKTSMRMSYTGEGHPLKLLLCVQKRTPLKRAYGLDRDMTGLRVQTVRLRYVYSIPSSPSPKWI
jgi:hypothetical protein